MSRAGGRRVRSLSNRLLIAGGVVTVLITVVVASLIFLSRQLHDRLEAATVSFFVEQKIADRINAAVMRQLALAAAFPVADDTSIQTEFLAAGAQVDQQMRRYLSRDLESDERLQLERVRAAHQRLEVAAIRAAGQFQRDLGDSGEASMAEVVEHAGAFIDAVNEFLVMRSEDEGLPGHQEMVFRLFYAAGAIVAALAVLATLGLVWTMRRRVGRPLAELARATEKLAAGDLGVRVAPGPDGELHTLAESFNRMANSLQRTTGELESRNAELEAAIEQLHTTQAELVQAEKLSAIGRMAAGFAHEINNPLASVLGYAQLLEARLDESPTPEPEELRAAFLEPILDEGQRARHLVRTLLGMSRRPGGAPGPVRLREIVEAVRTVRKYAFQQAGFHLEVDVPDVWVEAESQVLQGVFLNLVNNALDAMVGQSDGTLLVRAREDGDMVEIVLADDGPGFTHPERVFEPFFTTKPVGEGTGLGLALAHRFVTDFGGAITADNRDEGGARITMRLRKAVPEEVRATHQDRADAEAEDTPEGRRAAPRILVVEDEAPLRALQRRILGRIDAEIALADSAAAARNLLATGAVDLIISDVRMPGESGLDLFEWVRKERPELADRFLFVTGDLSAHELVELVEERPERLIQKPFEVAEYLSRVADALG